MSEPRPAHGTLSFGCWLCCLLIVWRTVSTAAAEPPPQWILVTTPALAEAATPLIQRRGDQGYEVTVIDVATLPDAEGGPDVAAALRALESADRDRSVLLLGTWEERLADAWVPPLTGTQGRMQGRATDHGYGAPAADGGAAIAVGRLPARSLEEARAMVSRILKFEDLQVQQNQIHLFVGHPGGRTEFERNFAANIIRTAVDQRLKRVHEQWSITCLMDLDDSPYSVAAADFGGQLKRTLQQGQLFSVYSGHSSPAAIYSRQGPVVQRADFASLQMSGPQGVLLSCGCYACQVEGVQGQGYGISAIRNADGPVAVIGAFGESYAAHGQLAFDGVLACLAQENPPRRLGAYWLAIQNGIARGEISQTEFLLYDMADGSNGQVPLEQQRREHAQMWTLLGDPATLIPLAPAVDNN